MYKIVVRENDLVGILELRDDQEFDKQFVLWDSRDGRPLTIELQSELNRSTDIKALRSERKSRRETARKYLKETDWYVIRLAELSTPIPQDIVTSRSNARSILNEQ